MFDFRVLTALCLSCIVGTCLADGACDEIRAPGDDPPNFEYREFAANVEMSRKELGKVTKIRLFYSERRNKVRMQILDEGKKKDIYYIANEGRGEVIYINYNEAGRGICEVKKFSEETEMAMLWVGGTRRGKIASPREFLQLEGYSGFGSDAKVALRKLPMSQQRGRNTVNVYESCRRLTYGSTTARSTDMTIKVTHYLDANSHNAPLKIILTGSGTLNGKARANFQHTYNFYDFTDNLDPIDLQTPEGVYCKGREGFPFPKLPPKIRFTNEIVNPVKGPDYRLRKVVYDTESKFSVVDTGEMLMFREYTSGLSFNIRTRQQTCTISNITDTGGDSYDTTTGSGDVKQYTMERFFFADGAPFEYIGYRTCRGMTADVYVSERYIGRDKVNKAAIEIYFAKRSVKNWNEKVKEYKEDDKVRMPIRISIWRNNLETQSIDFNLVGVDYSKMLFGTVDLRPCFEESRGNHLQLILKGSKKDIFNGALEAFKWQAVNDLSKYSAVVWWRFADFQITYDSDDVVIQFDILGTPPVAFDVAVQEVYVSAGQAVDNLKAAAKDGKIILHGYDKTKKDFSKEIPATLAVLT